MADGAGRFAGEIWRSIGGAGERLGALDVAGTDALPSAFPVTDFAVGSIAAAGLALAEVAGARGPIRADRRLASLWFGYALRPEGWEVPAPWDPIAGDYACRDGWIRLHTNAPHHRAAAERVLGAQDDKDGMARAVAGWDAQALEAAVIAEGGCAAQMRSPAEWAAHPQGRAVAAEPLVAWERTADTTSSDRTPAPARPLAGLRVLDLTRVLAGPVATRFLAAFGADVLRIDPPGWDEPGLSPDVTLGKTCARLDLRDTAGRTVFEDLLAGADVLVHGYRPGALDGLGYSAAERRRRAPGLIDVSLDAYGWTGPWAGRRGFDSLVQMSSGIAAAGQAWRRADRPVPLPVQALDHATGYAMAASVLRLLALRQADRKGGRARLSLARLAALLTAAPPSPHAQVGLAPASEADFAPQPEVTPWGPARRLRPPLAFDGFSMRWDRPARPLGRDRPAWAH